MDMEEFIQIKNYTLAKFSQMKEMVMEKIFGQMEKYAKAFG
jgi:hypothetical protein